MALSGLYAACRALGKAMTRAYDAEWELQAYVCKHLHRAGILHHGDQNSGKRGRKAQVMAKATGMCAGWPDLAVLLPRGPVFLEFKSARGRLTLKQAEVHKEMRKLGYEVHVVQTAKKEEAWEIVEKILDLA